MVFNMFHGTLQPLAGAARTLSQLAEDGLLPRIARRGAFARPTRRWVATLLTGALAILFLLTGDPIWLIAAANLTYLIGICLPSVAVWLLRRNEPDRERPYRAPRGTIVLGVVAAGVWGCLDGARLPAVRPADGARRARRSPTRAPRSTRAGSGRDRRRAGEAAGFARSLHLKLTGAMLAVLVLDGAGYLLAVAKRADRTHDALVTALEDIFVAVAMLTITVGR